MKNNKGVTLLALIIAMLVMLVLASMFTLPSLDVISKGRNLQFENEFNDVVSIVNGISSSVVTGRREISFDNFREATTEEIESFLVSSDKTELTEDDINLIMERTANANVDLEKSKKYYIFSGKELEKISLELEKAKNTYLINFYDGVVIAKFGKNETRVAGWIISGERTSEEISVASTININRDEYSELYYLESTGTQYIDTNLVQRSDISVEIKYQVIGQVPVLGTDQRLGIFGFVAAGNKECLMIGYERTGFYGIIDNWVKYTVDSTIIPVDNSIHTMRITTGSVKVDGIETPVNGVFDGDSNGPNLSNVSTTGKLIHNSSNQGNHLLLFAVKPGWSGNFVYGGSARIYEVIVTYNNNTEDTSDDTTYYFIPVLRKSDSKLGMYKYNLSTEEAAFLTNLNNNAGAADFSFDENMIK